MTLALSDYVRLIPDFPKAGIQFRDLTPLLANGQALQECTNQLSAIAGDYDMIAGVEARGFLFGAALTQATGKGLVLVRKAGKLPGKTIGLDYGLEYGTDRLEIHAGQIEPGTRVLVVDDVLATGGTADAAVTLLRKAGAIVERAIFVIELTGLGGMDRLRSNKIEPIALMQYEG